MIKGTPKRKSLVKIPAMPSWVVEFDVPRYLIEFSKANNLKPATYIVQGKEITA